MTDDPLRFAMVTTIQNSSPAGKLVSEFITTPLPDWDTPMVNLHSKINRTQSTRYNIYKGLNPSLEVHEIYKHRLTQRTSWQRIYSISGVWP